MNHPLGEWPLVKIFSWLADHDDEGDFTKREIAAGAEVTPTQMKRDFQSVIEWGMVTETRKIGGVSLFRVDSNNNAAKILFDLIDEVCQYTNESGELE